MTRFAETWLLFLMFIGERIAGMRNAIVIVVRGCSSIFVGCRERFRKACPGSEAGIMPCAIPEHHLRIG